MANGDTSHGSIMAFKVEVDPKTDEPTLTPAWISGNFEQPDPAVIANGVLFSLSNGENAVQRGGEAMRLENTHQAVLRALDAKTGKELYNSGSAISSWVHFSGLALANGKVYAVDHDSNLYCFGLPDGGAISTKPHAATNQ
jgi:outer membrane protein assembly factor BamB